MTQMTNALEQRSGVSTDEEMINLIKFQMGYSAAAKLASAADEMLKTLLNVT
jgi:flagellar hook-associated protein 1 FlgK